MTAHEMLIALTALAAKLGVTVRFDGFVAGLFERPGGLCWLRQRPVVVLDRDAPPIEKVATLAKALATFDVETIYVPPILRQRLDISRSTRPR